MDKWYLGFALSSTLLLSACGQQEQTSALDVTNGIRVNQSDYPAVVKLNISKGFFGSICTGTFVNDRQVVTAAHCVDGNPRITVNGARAISFVAQDNYDITLKNGVNELDLAIVNFPAGTSSSFREFTDVVPEKEDALEIVGFGNNYVRETSSGGITGGGAGVLRQGTNVLADTLEGMHATIGVREAGVVLEGEEVPLGEYSSTGSGDSGGPLFFNGKLAGVTSGGGIGETEDGLKYAVSFFTNISSESSQEFLAKHLR